MNRIIIALCFFLCLTVFVKAQGTSVYTVTLTTTGTAASDELDDIIALAKLDASNSNKDVTVYFNASGLVQITTLMPTIDISQGSITFDISTGASTPQGVELPASSSGDPTISYAFNVDNNSSQSHVTFKNITVKGFNYNNNTPREGMLFNYDNNVEVSQCTFDDNLNGVKFGTSDNLLITSNVAIYNGLCDRVFQYQNIGQVNNQNCTIQITSNTFNAPYSVFSESGPINYGIGIYGYLDTDHTSITVQSNSFQNLAHALDIQNVAPYSNNVFTPIVKNNQFDNNVRGITLSSPLKSWTVENNNFYNSNPSNRETDIWIPMLCVLPVLPNSHGIDFIAANNPFGLTPVNDGNTFTGSTSSSIITTGSLCGFQGGINIIGLDIQATTNGGAIDVLYDKYTIIRGNKITNGYPIRVEQSGNNSILPPAISNGYINGSNLNVDFSLQTSNSSELDYVIDFYKSNSQGSLLDYIGYSTISSLSSNYNASLSIPTNVTLVTGDKIAITVTGIGNQSSPANPIGTSEVIYYTLTDGPLPTCCDLNNAIKTSGGFNCVQQLCLAQLNVAHTSINCTIAATTCLNKTVSLYIDNTLCSCTGDVLYSWDFGDGSAVQTGYTASHSYSTAGTYSFTVTATPTNGTCAAPAPYTGTITVLADCCPASFDILASPPPPNNTKLSPFCTGPLDFSTSLGQCTVDNASTYSWTISDGFTSSLSNFTHSFAAAGTYTVNCTITIPGCGGSLSSSYTVQIVECLDPCTDCIGSFAPEPGDYVVSVWARETNPVNPNIFAAPEVVVSFPGLGAGTSIVAAAGNNIIDGWQRLEGIITVPAGASKIIITLKNNTTNGSDVFFDDIRVHPFNSSMKTYVYDPITLRLSAELDERNYATFYEYDEEGKLIRVKKETEKGVMTIQETRENSSK